MRKINKFSALYTAIIAMLLMGSAVFANTLGEVSNDQSDEASGWSQGHHHGHGRRGAHGLGFMEKLGLSDAQKEQIKQIHQNHRESMKPLMQELRAKQNEIRESTSSGVFNEALVTQKLTEMASVKAKLIGEQVKIHQETLSVLTPEQRTKMEQQREQFKSRRESRRSHSF